MRTDYKTYLVIRSHLKFVPIWFLSRKSFKLCYIYKKRKTLIFIFICQKLLFDQANQRIF